MWQWCLSVGPVAPLLCWHSTQGLLDVFAIGVSRRLAFLTTKGGQQVPQAKSKAKARARNRAMTNEGAEQTPDVSPPRPPSERPPILFVRGRNAGTLDCSPKRHDREDEGPPAEEEATGLVPVPTGLVVRTCERCSRISECSSQIRRGGFGLDGQDAAELAFADKPCKAPPPKEAGEAAEAFFWTGPLWN